MATDESPRRPPAGLRTAFRTDIAAAWQHARALHPDHVPYAFVLYGVEGGPPRLWPVVMTEESLWQAAQKYVERGYHETLDEAREALRWSVADSPLLEELSDRFPNVDAATAEHVGEMDDVKGYAKLLEAAIPAWQELNAEGLFGTGPARDALVLTAFTEDVGDYATMGWVEKLNPPAVAARFREATQEKGTYRSANGLVIAADGLSVYTVGSRKNPHYTGGNEEFIRELVAYDLRGSRLVRRWDYSYQQFGDGMRAVALDPSGASLIVLRQRYEKSAGHASLLRFPTGSANPTHSAPFDGETNGKTLTVSHDGERIAVAGPKRTLWTFDRQFALVNVHTYPDAIMALHYLRGGNLLLGTADELRRVDPVSGRTLASVRIGSKRLSVTEDESFVVVTARSTRSVEDIVKEYKAKHPDGKARPTFFDLDFTTQAEGFATLVRLPDLELMAFLSSPGLELGDCAVSPDGRTAAFRAKHVGKMINSLVVFDVGSGRMLGRRRDGFPMAHDLRFMPDSRTLAIAKSFTGETAPIDFWRIRDD